MIPYPDDSNANAVILFYSLSLLLTTGKKQMDFVNEYMHLSIIADCRGRPDITACQVGPQYGTIGIKAVEAIIQ